MKKRSRADTVNPKRAELEKRLLGANALTKIVDRLHSVIRKAEDPDEWRERCMDECRELLLQQKGTDEDWPLLLKSTQLMREAGVVSGDYALGRIFICAVHMTGEIDTSGDPVMMQISEQIFAVEERERMPDGHKLWQLNDPNTPPDYKRLARRASSYATALLLKRYGEDGIAELLLNDFETFKRRCKAGLLEWANHDTEVKFDDEFFSTLFG